MDIGLLRSVDSKHTVPGMCVCAPQSWLTCNKSFAFSVSFWNSTIWKLNIYTYILPLAMGPIYTLLINSDFTRSRFGFERHHDLFNSMELVSHQIWYLYIADRDFYGSIKQTHILIDYQCDFNQHFFYSMVDIYKMFFFQS